MYLLPYTKGKFFNGLIDDVRVYDRALSLQEVWSLAKTGTTDYACADMNMDQTVNLIDLAKMSGDWNQTRPMISINEFLADNASKLPLKSSEILDGTNQKTQWQFPVPTVVQPGDYLIVFASGKTQADYPGNYPYVDSAGYIHTNFELTKGGEYLGLIDSDGTTPIHEYPQPTTSEVRPWDLLKNPTSTFRAVVMNMLLMWF